MMRKLHSMLHSNVIFSTSLWKLLLLCPTDLLQWPTCGSDQSTNSLFVEMWDKLCSFLANAFDTEQLLKCMGQLKLAQPGNVLIYDFKKHRRCSETFRKEAITCKLVSMIELFFLCEFEFIGWLKSTKLLQPITLYNAFLNYCV
jgi:hypothetical protein